MHVALKHAILPVQVILRTGNGKSECACVREHAYARVCAMRVRVAEWEVVVRGWGWGVRVEGG